MPQKREAWIEQLAELPVFHGCTYKELRRIGGLVTMIHVPAGAVLCEEGQRGRETFVVIEGMAMVSVAGDNVTTVGRGDCLGEISLLDDGPRIATVTAATDMELLVLTRTEFVVLLEDVPLVSRRLLSVLATKLRSAVAPAHRQRATV
jgi:CRP/FNR family cyclic AMP-dependent transcriptional regulator